MSDLKFADSHNMVAFLEKPTECEGFEQIVKTVNKEVQIQALVDRKKVIITEASVKRDLQLEDAEWIECLPNDAIFEQLSLIGAKSTAWNGFSSKGSSNPTDPHHTPTIIQPSTSQPKKKQPRKSKKKNTEVPQPSGSTDDIANKNVTNTSNDPPQSEITELKERVKKLEKKKGSRTHKLKRLYKVGRSARVVSSEDEGLGDQEDASKQGRKINDIDQDAEVTLVDETQGRCGDDLVFDTSVLDGEEVFAGQSEVEKEVSVADPITTAGEVVTTVSVEVSTTILTKTTTVDELTLAQTLIEIKSAKPKVKKVVVQELVQSTTTTTPLTIPKAKSITFREPSESTTRTTPTPIPSNIKNKGKAKMIEPEKPLKEKEQIRLDEELTLKQQAKEKEEDRLAREKAQQDEDANISKWDNVQAMIDANYELAVRLHAEEQGELTIEERSRLFMELMDKRKKHFARLRAEEQRRKPLTNAQKRNQMCTYLKNMAGFPHNLLKNKSFDEVHNDFDKTMSWIDSFIPMDSEVVKDKVEGSEIKAEGSSKRAGEDLQQESTKKQKVDDDDKEKEDLK
ncbi:hypothetical protein Tco_1044643 [Tanacetum coccineum]|uniref:Uncharacterized protein n=1 Tax=Tanacetum coccineum TaxID=301880 RepID=A0ABQ5GT15_9ASTR